MIPTVHLKSRVWYPGSVTSGLVHRPSQVVITEEVNRHTLFQVRHEGKVKYLRETLRSGAPMVTDLMFPKGTHRWYGYVDSLKDKTDEVTGTAYTDLVGVGLTYPMKEADTLTNTTLVEAQRAIIMRSGLVPIVRGPLTSKPVIGGGRSLWTVLVTSAAEFQQYVFATGTTLNVLPVQEIINMYMVEAPILAYRPADYWGINTFEAPSTDNVAPRQIGYSVDPASSMVRSSSTTESMFTTYPTVISPSIDVTSQLDNDPIVQHAIAEGGGNVGVHAGKLVFLKDVSPGSWWLVLKVVHEFRTVGGSYRMSLKLARTRSIEAISEAAVRPARNLSRIGDNQERVNREDLPTLISEKTYVSGTSSWRNPPRWRPQC